MKSFLFLLLLFAYHNANSKPGFSISHAKVTTDSPRVLFERVWVDYDVTQDNHYGMRIHVKFTVYNMKETLGYLAIYFKEKDGKNLVAVNKAYSNKNGEVAVFRSIKPAYADASYKDLDLFIPYNEFNLSPGKYNLEMDIDLIYENGDLVQHLSYYEILYTKPQSTTGNAPEASFGRINIQQNVWKDNMEGMKIYLDYTVYNLQDKTSFLTIFFKDKNGNYLKDSNKKFYSVTGEVSVFETIKPKYAASEFTNFDLFIPYDELELKAGEHELQLEAFVISTEAGFNKKLTSSNFRYTKPNVAAGAGTLSNKPGVINVTYKDAWIDFDLSENGKKGIMVHANFTVGNMKEIDGYLAVYFFKKDGSKIFSNNTAFRSTSGQLAVYKSIKPLYDETDFKDLMVFIPYDEIALSPGRHDLKFEISVIYKNGGLIKNLTTKEFWLQKN